MLTIFIYYLYDFLLLFFVSLFYLSLPYLKYYPYFSYSTCLKRSISNNKSLLQFLISLSGKELLSMWMTLTKNVTHPWTQFPLLNVAVFFVCNLLGSPLLSIPPRLKDSGSNFFMCQWFSWVDIHHFLIQLLYLNVLSFNFGCESPLPSSTNSSASPSCRVSALCIMLTSDSSILTSGISSSVALPKDFSKLYL